MKFTRFIQQGFFPREIFLSECRFEQGFLLRRDVPTHLFSNVCFSEAFRYNFRHSTTIRHKDVVLLFANNNGWTILPMGNKCRPRVGSVFLDFSPARVSNGDSCPWFRTHVLLPTTMSFVDRTQASDLATPAMPIRHFASHPEVTWQIVSSTDDPLGGRVSRRVNAGVFCPVHHGGQSSRFHETSCSKIFDCLSRFRHCQGGSFGCSEILSNAVSFHKLTEFSLEFTSHVRDQVIHGTCPTYPNHLKYRHNVIRPFGWHWKANVESRGKIYNGQELKHLFV